MNTEKAPPEVTCPKCGAQGDNLVFWTSQGDARFPDGSGGWVAVDVVYGNIICRNCGERVGPEAETDQQEGQSNG